ncbi:MAG: gliding motility-associated C-terminal domain-containing protein [Flavobacteriales bacterium]|nr:gliding motility-associated C-terminal domain-containing protein [Flavobacteriales bacterium]
MNGAKPYHAAFRATVLVLVFLLCAGRGNAQVNTFYFNSGPIPQCDTSIFTANVAGIGTLQPYGTQWGYSLTELGINITTDHPQTLQIILTSPAGTDLVLSEFNGAGGQNYTNTVFGQWWNPNITTGAAPFTGTWAPQGGNLDVFDWELGDGTWTITVIDTACANGGTGPNGTWTPGWFDGNGQNGGFNITFFVPMCPGGIPWGTSTICAGGSVDIMAYYQWSGYTITVMDPWFVPVADPTAVTLPGQYNITAYDPWDGCSYFAWYDVIVEQPPALGPDLITNVCTGAPAMDLTAFFPLTGTTNGWTLNGAPITNANAAAAYAPGVYQVIAATNGGCSDTADVTLSILPGPALGPDQSADACQGTTVDLTGLYSTAGLTVYWTFAGAMVPDPTAVDLDGLYQLVVVNADGCGDTAVVTLTMQYPPALGPDQTIDLCGTAPPVDLLSLFNTAGLTTSWTLNGMPIPNSAASAASAPGVYEVIATNTGICSDTALATINQLATPALGADQFVSLCQGNATDLTAYFSTAGLTADWTISGAPVADPTAVGVAGQYMLVVSNSVSCSDTALVSVSVQTNPSLGLDQSLAICAGSVIDLTTLYTTNGYTTSWSQNGSPVPPPVNASSSGVYTLAVADALGCADTAVVDLVVDPVPMLGADQAQQVCGGASFDLSTTYTTTGLVVQWTENGSAVADPAAVTQPGAYQLVVTNNYGCADTAVVVLAVNANPVLGADQWFELCPWQSVDLTGLYNLNGLTASYTLNGAGVTDPTAAADSGTYVVTVQDMNGCAGSATVVIDTVACVCEAEIVADANCLQDPAYFSVVADSAIWDVLWDFGGGAGNVNVLNPEVFYTTEGNMVVTLEATLSCGVVQVQDTIHLMDCSDSCSVFLPNAFTPDGDAVNDDWTMVSDCVPEEYLVYIFNRWGELIHTGTDPLSPWDGTYNGTLVQDGVYVYRLVYRMPYQEGAKVIGHVALLR